MERRMRLRAIACLVAAGCVACAATPASASAASIPQAAQPLRKLSRGLANGFGGVLAIPVTIRQVGEAEGPLAGLTWGLFMGIGVAVTRTLVGVAEVATFPIPLPEVGYDPLIRPEFLFQPEA